MQNQSPLSTKPMKPRSELKVLVIDDDPMDLEIALDALKSLGIRNVSGVSGGVLALNAMTLSKHSAPFDVLMCDLQMPGMDGFDFFESMCEGGFSGGLIIVSGQKSSILHSAKLVAELRRIMVLGSVAKPLTKEALAVILRQ